MKIGPVVLLNNSSRFSRPISSTDRSRNRTLLSLAKDTKVFTSEVAMERRQVIGFAEQFVGHYGPGTAFIPWCGAASQCPSASLFAPSIPRGSSKRRTEPESDSMEEVIAFAALKSIKRTSR